MATVAGFGMVTQSLASQIHEQLDQLPPEQQRQVLDFTRSLVAGQIHGVPGKNLLRFAGGIDAQDLQAMKQAIEEGCEQVDHSNQLG